MKKIILETTIVKVTNSLASFSDRTNHSRI